MSVDIQDLALDLGNRIAQHKLLGTTLSLDEIADDVDDIAAAFDDEPDECQRCCDAESAVDAIFDAGDAVALTAAVDALLKATGWEVDNVRKRKAREFLNHVYTIGKAAKK